MPIVEFNNFFAPLADNFSSSSSKSKEILIETQRTYADLYAKLKLSSSVDFDNLEDKEVQENVIPDLDNDGRESSYQFADDELFERMQEERNIPSPSLLPEHSDYESSDDEEEDTKDIYENKVSDYARARYSRWLAHMRDYFRKKGLEDLQQQNRLLFCILQGLGGWANVVPQTHVGFLLSQSNEMVCVSKTRRELSLTMDPKGSGDALVTLRIPVERCVDLEKKTYQGCGEVVTTLCIPKDPLAEIRLQTARNNIDHPVISPDLKRKCQELQNQVAKPNPPQIAQAPLPEHLLQRAHHTPRTSFSTQPFGYQSFWQQTKGWFSRNWLPVAAGVSIVVGSALLAAFILSGGGAFLSLALMGGIGLVLTEAEITVAVATGMVMLYAATAAIAYAVSTARVPSIAPRPQPVSQKTFVFEPPLPQLATEEELVEQVEPVKHQIRRRSFEDKALPPSLGHNAVDPAPLLSEDRYANLQPSYRS